jgi:hypothetical protein
MPSLPIMDEYRQAMRAQAYSRCPDRPRDGPPYLAPGMQGASNSIWSGLWKWFMPTPCGRFMRTLTDFNSRFVLTFRTGSTSMEVLVLVLGLTKL